MKPYSQTFLDAINEDDKYRLMNARLVTPSEEELKKADRSTMVGVALASIVGVGWVKRLPIFIVFKESPPFLAKFVDDKKYPASYCRVDFYKFFKYTSLKQDRKMTNLALRPRKKGLLHKAVIGLTAFSKGDIPGKQGILNDSELADGLVSLYKHKIIREIDSVWLIGIGFDKEEKQGVITINLDKDASNEKLRETFACINDIFSHIEQQLDTTLPTDILEKIKKASEEREINQRKRRGQIKKQISLRPKDANLHIVLARDFRPKGAYVGWNKKQKEDALKAETEYSKAIQLQPDLIEPRLELGMLYVAMSWQLPEIEDALGKAEIQLRKVIELDPRSIQAYKALGWTYCYLKKFEEAEKHLKIALELSPNDKMSLFALGIVFANNGKSIESTNTFQRIFPTYRSQQHKIERVQLASDFHTEEVKSLGIELINKAANKRVKLEKIENFGWLD